VIRKGKAHEPNEFGSLVRTDEVENGIVSGYEVPEGKAADTNSWLPAIEHHQACFGDAPEMATADRGFFSAKNEREADALGVERVILPATGRLSKTRAKRKLERHMVLAVGPRDPALLAGFGDCQLSGAFGTLGGIRDLVAQLVVARTRRRLLRHRALAEGAEPDSGDPAEYRNEADCARKKSSATLQRRSGRGRHLPERQGRMASGVAPFRGVTSYRSICLYL
jgi:hypothetical protein